VLGVTDHDTLAGCGEAAAACAAEGLEFVPGIEITAAVDGGDVHVLGYFLDVRSAAMQTFLEEQRRRRVDRVRQIVDRLGDHGIALDADEILRPALNDRSRSVGRPWVARALVAAGHVTDSNEAFDRWLERGRPAFVPRTGGAPAETFERIHEAGGIASLAHPGLVGHDEWLPLFAGDGLDALEAYHPDHDASATSHYVALAGRLGLAVTGGSDYHGDPSHGPGSPGAISLPPDQFERLKARRRSVPGFPGQGGSGAR
jgi:predicted metal-dependent phosphoesterase TrpH